MSMCSLELLVRAEEPSVVKQIERMDDRLGVNKLRIDSPQFVNELVTDSILVESSVEFGDRRIRSQMNVHLVWLQVWPVPLPIQQLADIGVHEMKCEIHEVCGFFIGRTE